MTAILGMEFNLGRAIPSPAPMGLALPADDVLEARIAWTTLITEAVDHDGAWGLLRVRPDGEVNLFDARPESVYAATDRGGTVHLLLAQKVHQPL